MTENHQKTNHDKIPCSCGKHFGLGVWTVEKRAEVYAWYRDKQRKKYTPQMAAWLAGYQRFHGYINTKN